MSRTFRLAGLLRLRRLEEERAAAMLGAANAATRRAEAREIALTSLMASTPLPAYGDEVVWLSAIAARSALVALVEEARVAREVAARRGEIAGAEWAAARTRVATLDKLAERHEAEVRAEDERAEQLLLDEAAIRIHAKEDA
jgi:flagellar protein FliJ